MEDGGRSSGDDSCFVTAPLTTRSGGREGARCLFVAVSIHELGPRWKRPYLACQFMATLGIIKIFQNRRFLHQSILHKNPPPCTRTACTWWIFVQSQAGAAQPTNLNAFVV